MTRQYRKFYFVSYLGRYYRYLYIWGVYTQVLMVKYHLKQVIDWSGDFLLPLPDAPCFLVVKYLVAAAF